MNGWGGTAGSRPVESGLLRTTISNRSPTSKRGPTKCSRLTLSRSCRPARTIPNRLREAAVVLVAGRPAVGFARVDVVDGLAHLEQLGVLPEDTRMGIGGELVEAACRWAADQGLRAITLITFADVPWNAPFYAARGFREIDELTPGLAELRDWERDLGLDRVGRRVVMRRDLGAPPPEPGAGSPVVAGFAPVPRSPAPLSAT